MQQVVIWNLGSHLRVLPSQLIWMGRNSPVLLILNVTLICLFSSISFTDTILALVGIKVYFPGEKYDQSFRSRLSARSSQIWWPSIIDEKNLEVWGFFNKNCSVDWILPVAAFLSLNLTANGLHNLLILISNKLCRSQ